jgi:hypothetical protein
LPKLRARLFERNDTPKGMTLTPRDLNILICIARHRFLTSSQLARLDGGSAQGVLRCLRALYDHGYVDRPRQQLATLHDEGPRPFVYGLAQKGARVLREHGFSVNHRVDWSEKNRRAGPVFLAHTIDVAEFLIQLEVACRWRPDVQFIQEEEILALAPEATQVAREPLRWEAVSVEQGRRELWSVIPDGLFGLSFSDGSASYFLLEVDRGTIPITRNRADHRSIARKFKTYYDGWRAGRHVEQYGLKQMRVATVTNSRERMHNMVSVVRSITEGKGSNFFLFIDQEMLAANDPLDVQWVTGKGEQLKLID